MRPSFVSLMMRRSAPPIWLGIVVGATLTAVETVAVVCLKQLTGAALRHVVHGRCFGGLHGLGIRLVRNDVGTQRNGLRLFSYLPRMHKPRVSRAPIPATVLIRSRESMFLSMALRGEIPSTLTSNTTTLQRQVRHTC